MVNFHSFSPHWRVGCLFLVLYPRLLLPVLLTHSLTPSRTHALTHSLTHTHTHTTHSLTHSFTHALMHSLTHWRFLVSAALPVAFAWQARHLVLCKGSDVRPGVPWSPVAFASQPRHLVLCKGSDVRPGVPWSPLLCRWLLRGRRGTWCSARGRMYALASLHSLTHILIHSPDSPTITPPSLLYFLFPSCFSMLSLSLEKLVTCGVIRSYNFVCLVEGNPTFFGPRRPFRPRTPLSWRSPSPLSPWLGPWSRPEEKRRLFLWGYVYVYIYIYVCI